MAYALIDADSIYFRAAYVSKKQNEIRKIINTTMKEIESAVMAQHFDDVTMVVAVKGKGNFRNDIYPGYKKNRKELEPDMKKALAYGHEYMIDRWKAQRADGMEADDLVSIWAHEADEPYTIVGIDKDLLQIPGNHYNFNKKVFTDVDADRGNYLLMCQCLTGDSTDNIPGIKGIGPKKAERILSGLACPDRRWRRVRAAWRGHGAGDPELSRRLLQMLTSWEELHELKSQIAGETPVSEQDVLSEQEQDSRVSDLSERDEGRDDGDELAFWRQHRELHN